MREVLKKIVSDRCHVPSEIRSTFQVQSSKLSAPRSKFNVDQVKVQFQFAVQFNATPTEEAKDGRRFPGGARAAILKSVGPK